MEEKIVEAERQANNTCQLFLMLSALIGLAITAIVFIFAKDLTLELVLVDNIITYFIWRIMVKHHYGSDAFEG